MSDKDFPTTCKTCGAQIMMRYSTKKDKYYPTDVPGDYKSFHNCSEKSTAKTTVEKKTKICPFLSIGHTENLIYCLGTKCGLFASYEKCCIFMFLMKR